MKRKIILGLGALGAIVAPVTIASQCGGVAQKAVDSSITASIQNATNKKIILTVNPAVGSGKKIDSQMINDAINKLPGIANGEINMTSFTGVSIVVGDHSFDAISQDGILDQIKLSQNEHVSLITNYTELKSLVKRISLSLTPGGVNIVRSNYYNCEAIIFGDSTIQFATGIASLSPQDITADSKDEFLLVANGRRGGVYSLASTSQGGQNGISSLADDKVYLSKKGEENDKHVVSFYFKDNFTNEIKSTISVNSIAQKLLEFAKTNNELKSSFVA